MLWVPLKFFHRDLSTSVRFCSADAIMLSAESAAGKVKDYSFFYLEKMYLL